MKLRIFDNTPEEIAASELNPENGMIHSNDRIYTMMCINGHGRFYTNTGEEFFVGPQDYVLVYQRDFQYDQQSSDFHVRSIVVDKAFLTHLLDPDFRLGLNKLFSRPRRLHVGKNQLELYEKITRFLKMLSHGEDMKEYRREIINGYLRVFTYTSLMNLEAISEETQGYNSKRENKVSDAFLDLVRKHFKEERCLHFYAKELGMSLRNLSFLVLKATGRHTTEWIEDYTIEEIKRLLAHSDMTVQAISYELNFSTPSHLIKYFKKVTGVTPREYRLNYQKSKKLAKS